MSKGNPRKAVAAILPLAIEAAPGVTVRPMTLGMFAALERIGSPLVTGEEAQDTLALIPSLYLLTHDPREVFRGNVLDLAMEWADAQPVTVVEAIEKAAYRQMNAVFDVLPDVEDEKKKAMTAGSPRSSRTRPKSGTGATGKSSGRRPPRRSAS